ncbi:uncharacterized protein V6R79_018984 [Siganus canaliculatus]
MGKSYRMRRHKQPIVLDLHQRLSVTETVCSSVWELPLCSKMKLLDRRCMSARRKRRFSQGCKSQVSLCSLISKRCYQLVWIINIMDLNDFLSINGISE